MPGGSKRNADYFGRWVTWAASVDAPARLLLADAQTSGGLLIATDRPAELLAALAARGVVSAEIGVLEPGAPGTITVD